MLYGYAGKIAWINLTDGTTKVRKIEEDVARK